MNHIKRLQIDYHEFNNLYCFKQDGITINVDKNIVRFVKIKNEIIQVEINTFLDAKALEPTFQIDDNIDKTGVIKLFKIMSSGLTTITILFADAKYQKMLQNNL